MMELKENKDQIIIVGAGVAGLSLAIQLTEKNIPCLVVEARDHFGDATSGVMISGKGAKVLENMGIRDIGEKTEHLNMHFGKSKVTFKVKNKEGASPAFIVTRLAVFEKLRERINELGIRVVYNFTLENVIENTDDVVAISTEGQRIQGKYLVGTDGVGSKVRKILNPDSNSEKRYAGYLGLGFIFPSDEKVDMSLFYNISGNAGLGSIGKISQEDSNKNNFLWSHIHMTEAEAKAITDKEVYERITERAKNWPPYLQQVFEQIKADPNTILYHLPVYNGNVPEKWYSERLFLIGDAAHPYGPGGHGISLAMLDAEALSNLFATGITEEKKVDFKNTRGAIAKTKGESAEKKNKPENQITTKSGLLFKSIIMKLYCLFSGGKTEF